MRKFMSKTLALVMVLAVVLSVVAVSAVSVSAAANTTIELIGDTKANADMYKMSKDGADKNKFSVVKASDLKAGEVEYKGPAENAYYAEIGNDQERDGMGIYFNKNIDVTPVTNGKEGNYMLDMWLWVEDTSKLNTLVFRTYEANTYNTWATVGSGDNKVECLGEYRLFNISVNPTTLVNGWNHVKLQLPTFGLSSNAFESEAAQNFRNSETKKSICAFSIMNRSDGKSKKKLGDYAIASLRITSEKQIMMDYPEEYPDQDMTDVNDLTGEDEVESKQLFTKIASKKLDEFVKALQNDLIINVADYDEACQAKVKQAATDAGIEIVDLGEGKWTKAGGANDTVSSGSGALLYIIIAAVAVVVIAGVVVLLVVLKKKKSAPAVVEAVVEAPVENNDDEAEDEE